MVLRRDLPTATKPFLVEDNVELSCAAASPSKANLHAPARLRTKTHLRRQLQRHVTRIPPSISTSSSRPMIDTDVRSPRLPGAHLPDFPSRRRRERASIPVCASAPRGAFVALPQAAVLSLLTVHRQPPANPNPAPSRPSSHPAEEPPRDTVLLWRARSSGWQERTCADSIKGTVLIALNLSPSRGKAARAIEPRCPPIL